LPGLLDDSKRPLTGQPFFELGNLEMPEITDNELWTLFTGKDAPPDNFEWPHDRCMNLIKQREPPPIIDPVWKITGFKQTPNRIQLTMTLPLFRHQNPLTRY